MSFFNVYSGSSNGQTYSLDCKEITSIRDTKSKEYLNSFLDKCVLAFINHCCPTRFQNTRNRLELKREVKELFWDLIKSNDEAITTNSFYKLKQLAEPEFKYCFSQYYDSESDSWVLKTTLPNPDGIVANEAIDKLNLADNAWRLEKDTENEEIVIQHKFKLGISPFSAAINRIKNANIREQCVFALKALKSTKICSCFSSDGSELENLNDQDKFEALVFLLCNANKELWKQLNCSIEPVYELDESESATKKVKIRFNSVDVNNERDVLQATEMIVSENQADAQYTKKIIDKYAQERTSTVQNKLQTNHEDEGDRAHSPTLKKDVERDGLIFVHEGPQEKGNDQVEPQTNSGNLEAPSASDITVVETLPKNDTVKRKEKVFRNYEQFLSWWHEEYGEESVSSLHAFEVTVGQFFFGQLVEHTDDSTRAQTALAEISDSFNKREIRVIKLPNKKLLIVHNSQQQSGIVAKSLLGEDGFSALCQSYIGQAVFYLDCSNEELSVEQRCHCLSLNVIKKLYPPHLDTIRG